MSKIFGGSKSKSRQQSTQSSNSQSFAQSGNRAFDILNNSIGQSSLGAYNTGLEAMNRELAGGYEGYKDNNSFDFMRLMGLDRTATPYASQGAFNSGAAMKALSKYDANYKDQFYNNYLDRLYQQSQMGLAGGNLLAGAGNTSTQASSSSSRGQSSGYSTSKSNNGIGNFVGAIAAGAAASDVRVKTDITRVDSTSEGLPIYTYRYIWEDETAPLTRGVMAHEVAEMQPDALGPRTSRGFMTVDYSKLKR